LQRVSLIVPVYFNEPSLSLLIERVRRVVKSLKGFAFEFIFVEDGSGDRSFQVLEEWNRKDSRVKILKLTRNFGSQNAMMVGVSRAQGDCLIVMGADLQAPPEIIPLFLKEWKDGHKIVIGSRQKRRDPWTTILFAKFYYNLIGRSIRNFPKGGFDVFLMDRKVKDYILNIGSRNTLLEVSIISSGYAVKEVPYIRLERPFGKSRWTFFRKVKLAVDSLTAYSYLPVLMLFLLGAGLILLSVVGTLVAVFLPSSSVRTLESNIFIHLGLLGIGVNTIGLGIVGEYLWRILEETRKFPGFVVEKEIGFAKKRARS
jgi:polyisoprenyl-phosphate glycosyltransferase